MCSAKPEYEYVKSLYGYKDNVVKMLGLCRYDALYKNEQPTKSFAYADLAIQSSRGLTKRICKKNITRCIQIFFASEKLKTFLKIQL